MLFTAFYYKHFKHLFEVLISNMMKLNNEIEDGKILIN